jgi:hypothetical protein
LPHRCTSRGMIARPRGRRRNCVAVLGGASQSLPRGPLADLGIDFYTKLHYNVCRVRDTVHCTGQGSKNSEEVTIAGSPHTTRSPSRLERVFLCGIGRCAGWMRFSGALD